MTLTVDHREHSRRSSLGGSESAMRDRRSSHGKSSPRQERSPVHRRSSPPARTSSSHRTRSPAKEKMPDRARSPAKEKMPDRARPPVHIRSRSPRNKASSRSPSPRTRRLRQAQAEREAEIAAPRDLGRTGSREEREKGRQRERGEDRDAPSKRSVMRDENDGGSSRPSRRKRSVSPEEHSHKSRHRSRSPSRASNARSRNEVNLRSADKLQDGDHDSVAEMKAAEEALEAKEKEKPSFELSGKLAEETNRFRGVTLLFNEPPDARKPDVRWRLYVFKAGEVLNEPLYVHRQSCYLFGRERKVADIPTDHPSCSKQHAVIQFRLVEIEKPDGLLSKQVRPYLMDLGSTNGTFINDNRIEPQRYYELFEKDTIKFGNSSREYVILHENSAA